MVSLRRLLAAADESRLDENAPLVPVRSQDHFFAPPFLPPASIPLNIRPIASDSATDESVRVADSRFASLLPLQRLLRDLGPVATSPKNMATLARTLAQFGRPSEAAVASALLFLASALPQDSANEDSHTMFHLFALFCSNPENPSLDPALQQAVASASQASVEWRPDVLVQAVNSVASQFNAPLDWRLVIHSLDVDGLESRLSQSAFIQLAKAYIAGTGGTLLSADCLVDAWHHSSSQFCILSHALGSPELIDWNVLSAFDGADSDDMASPYSRVALVEKLVELDARELIQAHVKEAPDVVLLSLTCAKPKRNTSLQQKLIVTLLTSVIAMYPASEKALRQMWNVSPSLVEAGIISFWKKDPGMLPTALSIIVDLNILSDFLASSTSLEFSLELALLAYREDALKLEDWLSKFLSARGPQAVSVCTLLMARKVTPGESRTSLTVESASAIFRCLFAAVSAANSSSTQDLMDQIRDVLEAYRCLDPRVVDSLTTEVHLERVAAAAAAAMPVVMEPSPPPETPVQAPAIQNEVGSDAAGLAAAMLLPVSDSADGTTAGFPSDVEKEADVFFGKLYMGALPNDHAVEYLQKLKESSEPKERKVFDCMVHTLFDEYRFFKKYPDRELKITGRLFGSIIQYSLISGHLLGLAARCVLDALRTVESAPEPIGRLVKFGLCALERFRTRLPDWPQYCTQILDIPRLVSLAPELIGEVRKSLELFSGSSVPSEEEKRINLAVLDGEPPPESIIAADAGVPGAAPVTDPNESANNVSSLLASPTLSATNTPVKASISSTSLRASPSASMDDSLGISAGNLTSLLGLSEEEANKVVAPDESVQDKIKFIFNNLSNTTMDDKVQDILVVLRPEFQRYFSVYLVVKRASTESNFHHLYMTMLDRLDPHLPELFRLVYDTSYRRVRVLLSPENAKSSSPERLVLKSLGSWIGSLTLARDKPLLRRDIDLKELLLDAYSNGRLSCVVPFVSKVLEACPRSKIFRTTNPWVRGVLSLMKEIFSVIDLKLNLKFELQILCKSLHVDVSSLTASDLLRSRPAPDKTHNPDFTTKKSGSPPPRTSPSPTASSSPELVRPYFSGAPGTNTGVPPVFTLPETQADRVAQPQGMSSRQAAAVGRMDVPSSLVSNGLGGMSQDPVGDLSSILVNASISSAVGSTAIPRSSLSSHTGMSVAPVPGTAAVRQAQTLNPSEGTLLPNLAQYIQISPSLVLFQTSPHLKRLIPLAIDRAIREIIQPVVERSCAIAFLTTKELTLKDFANEPDMAKVKRAAQQMVQQLAGSLALVTSKEPLRVSMGNQLRLLLGPSVTGDQNLLEQTAQVLCVSNLEIGCAVIETHAKEKAARDLSDKIGPAFMNRQTQHSAYSLGLTPGPEVHRVYDEFSRIHRVGGPPQQYPNAQGVATPTHQLAHPETSTSAAAASAIPPAPSQILPRPVHNVADHRTNGSLLDPSVDGRVIASTAQTAATFTRQESFLQPPGSSRKSASPGPSARPETALAPSSAMYGTALPVMASPTSVASAILAAAGSTNNSTGGSPHSLTGSAGRSANGPGEEVLSTQQVLERFNSIYPRLTSLTSSIVSSSGSSDAYLSDVAPEHEIHSLWIQIPSAVKRSVTADEAGMAVAQKVFKRLFEGDSNLYREVHVLILEGLRESCRRLSKELSSWLAYSEDWKKLHKDCIIALIKPGALLNITSYDEVLAKAVDGGRNSTALEFACYLVQRAVIDEPLVTAGELYLTLECLSKIARRPASPSSSVPEGLSRLVEAARKVVHKPARASLVTGANDAHANAKNGKEAEPADPAGAREYVAGHLLEWQRILASDVPSRPVPDHVVVAFLAQIRVNALSNEDGRERFFRLTVELVCTVTRYALHSRGATASVAEDLVAAPYTIVEATVRLIVALCRQDPNNTSDTGSKGVGILCQFLVALVRDVLKSSQSSDLRPHFRLFNGLIAELAVGAVLRDDKKGDPAAVSSSFFEHAVAERLELMRTKRECLHYLEDKASGYMHDVNELGGDGRERAVRLDNPQALVALVGALSACSPMSMPGFVFSWLQLVSNKQLLPSLLSLVTPYGWPLFRVLLVRMLEFLSRHLQDSHMPLPKGIRILYSGMLRVLLVLLHDFPEFLCAYHFSLCNAIPSNCIQLRNLVLASFPKDMRLPDPFNPELNVEELPDMLRQPLILSDYTWHLTSSGLQNALDAYLHGNGNEIPDLEKTLVSQDVATGVKTYDAKAMGCVVLYVGQFAVSRLTAGESPRLGGNALQVFRSLAAGLDAEGLHHLFNEIVNQLRYPNNNTMYYSSLLLRLFLEAREDSVKEQITRVLVERLIANRPHPWGLLITFVQLIKSSEYNFWSHGFVRCAPEIEQLFENVAKFCVGPVLQGKHHSIMTAS